LLSRLRALRARPVLSARTARLHLKKPARLAQVDHRSAALRRAFAPMHHGLQKEAEAEALLPKARAAEAEARSLLPKAKAAEAEARSLLPKAEAEALAKTANHV